MSALSRWIRLYMRCVITIIVVCSELYSEPGTFGDCHWLGHVWSSLPPGHQYVSLLEDDQGGDAR